jgi:hypothetical protein
MKTVSLKLEDKQVDYLKKLSHQLSLERNEDLSFSDLVREALDKTFPMHKEK